MDFGELGQDCGQIIVVPAGSFQLASYGAFGEIHTGEVQCQFTQQCQIVRAVVLPVPALVLVEHDVQYPVQAVLDPLVGPCDLVEPLR